MRQVLDDAANVEVEGAVASGVVLAPGRDVEVDAVDAQGAATHRIVVVGRLGEDDEEILRVVRGDPQLMRGDAQLCLQSTAHRHW